jgi:hypothetical protein
MLLYALEKEHENSLYQAWVSAYPHMDESSFESFEDFKKKNNPSSYAPHENIEELTAQLESVIEKYEEVNKIENI